MAVLEWSGALELHLAPMDDTHRDFVQLLQRADAALDADADAAAPAHWLARLDALIDHTVEHFAMEQRWMDDIGFDAGNCHARQHASVIHTLKQVRATLAQQPDPALMRQVLGELGQWFVMHAQSMDAALRDMVQATGYDPASRRCLRPLPPDSPARTSCGSTACR